MGFERAGEVECGGGVGGHEAQVFGSDATADAADGRHGGERRCGGTPEEQRCRFGGKHIKSMVEFDSVSEWIQNSPLSAVAAGRREAGRPQMERTSGKGGQNQRPKISLACGTERSSVLAGKDSVTNGRSFDFPPKLKIWFKISY